MKFIYIFFIIIYSFISEAQVVSFQITGNVTDTSGVRYAYLVRTGELLLVSPIVNNKFQFKGSVELNGELYKYGVMFLSESDSVTDKQVLYNFHSGNWQLGRSKILKSIIFEDITFQVTNAGEMINSRILKDGQLTRQIDERLLAIKERRIIEFIEKYPDSPLSMNEIKAILKFFELPSGGAFEAFGSPKAMFALLSDRLKKSKEGVELKAKIDKLILE